MSEVTTNERALDIVEFRRRRIGDAGHRDQATGLATWLDRRPLSGARWLSCGTLPLDSIEGQQAEAESDPNELDERSANIASTSCGEATEPGA